MNQDRMVGWCTLFLAIVGKDAPTYPLKEDLDELERNHFWKAKKWAYANLNRLFVRFVLRVRDSHPRLIWTQIWPSNKQPKERHCRDG